MQKVWSIWFEVIHHYTCPHCGKWISISTIAPVAGQGCPCIHCGQYSKIPQKMLTRDQHGQEWALSGYRMVDAEIIPEASSAAIDIEPEAPTGL